MVFRRWRRIAAAITASALLGGCVAASVAFAPSVRLATGTPGGISHPVGNAICRMFNLEGDYPERPCVAVNTEGSVGNIQRVKNGKSTFGLSQADLAYAAFHGEGPFSSAGPDPKLRLLIALYPEDLTVIARSNAGINNFEDLRGKRIGIGASGAGYSFTRDAVLGFYGWTVSDAERVLELGPAEQNQTLCSNKVDAIIFVAGHPDGLTQEATTSCEAELVRVAGPSVARLLATHPYYIATVIPGGLYRGNPDDVPTIATQSVLITSSDVPEDLAYAVVKAVAENFPVFQRMHPALSTLALKDLVPKEAVAPMHPGALKYFREAGLVH